MSIELTVTAKNQITLRQAVLEHLHIRPGDKVAVVLLPDGRLELKAARDRHAIGHARGVLHRPGQRVVTLDEMRDVIEQMDVA